MLVRVAVGAATVVVGFLGGVQLHEVVASSGEPAPTFRAIDPRAHEPPEPPEPPEHPEVVLEDCDLRLAMSPPYPENAHGMTFGSGAAIDADDPGPDLVAVHGTNGRCGFVRAADREGATEGATGPDPDGRDIPLYAQDGVTVIGEFHVGGRGVLTSRAPGAPRSTP